MNPVAQFKKRLLEEAKSKEAEGAKFVKSLKRQKPDKDALKSRTKTKITSIHDLEPGHEISFVRSGYKHHGVIISKNEKNGTFEIVHLTGTFGELVSWSGNSHEKASVIKQVMELVKIKEDMYIYEYKSASFQPEVVIQRAEFVYQYFQLIGQKYNLLRLNCQHISSYCVTGVLFSKKLESISDQNIQEAEKNIDRMLLHQWEIAENSATYNEMLLAEREKIEEIIYTCNEMQLKEKKRLKDMINTNNERKHLLMERAEAHLRKRGDEDLRIVLVGSQYSKTSATGNTILGSLTFDTGRSFSLDESQIGVSYFGSRKIRVVQSPSFLNHTDYKRSSIRLLKDFSTKMTSFVKMSLPGPHVFLLVISVYNFEEPITRQIKFLNQLIKAFGDNFRKYAIVAITDSDELGFTPLCIEQFLRLFPDTLNALLKQCGNRFILFNNNTTDDKRKITMKALVNMIEEIIENNDTYYIHDVYQEAENRLKDKVRHAAFMKEFDLRKEIDKIELEFKQHIMAAKCKNQDLENKIRKHNETTEQIQREKQSMVNRYQKLENELLTMNKKVSKEQKEESRTTELKDFFMQKMTELQKFEGGLRKCLEDIDRMECNDSKSKESLEQMKQEITQKLLKIKKEELSASVNYKITLYKAKIAEKEFTECVVQHMIEREDEREKKLECLQEKQFRAVYNISKIELVKENAINIRKEIYFKEFESQYQNIIETYNQQADITVDVMAKQVQEESSLLLNKKEAMIKYKKYVEDKLDEIVQTYQNYFLEVQEKVTRESDKILSSERSCVPDIESSSLQESLIGKETFANWTEIEQSMEKNKVTLIAQIKSELIEHEEFINERKNESESLIKEHRDYVEKMDEKYRKMFNEMWKNKIYCCIS